MMDPIYLPYMVVIVRQPIYQELFGTSWPYFGMVNRLLPIWVFKGL